jgi:hypothetical protein
MDQGVTLAGKSTRPSKTNTYHCGELKTEPPEGFQLQYGKSTATDGKAISFNGLLFPTATVCGSQGKEHALKR